MKRLNHKNITKLYEVIDDPSKDKLYLVMPLADCGESMSFDSQALVFKPNSKLQSNRVVTNAQVSNEDNIEFYDENTIKNLSRDLVSALDYLHNDL